MTIERHKPSFWWECPYCGEKIGDWPIAPRGHLISDHAPTTPTAQSHIVSLALPDFGEDDVEGKRYHLHCPFCEVSPSNFASFKDKAALKAHLTAVHGCS